MVLYSNLDRIGARDSSKNGMRSKILLNRVSFRIKQFLSVLLFLVIIGWNKQQETKITVEFPDQPEVNTLIYTVPISGTTYIHFSDTLKASETGKFELNLNITQPSFVSIRVDGQTNRIKLLVEQGNNYRVSIDPHKNVQIKGANEKGQMFYTTLPEPFFVEMELRNMGFNPFNPNDTMSFAYIHHKINELKQSDMSKFKELLDDNEITKSFFEFVQKDRDLYYASLEARFLIIKLSISTRLGIKVDDELLENLKKIYDQYPPGDENLLFSSFWPEYAIYHIEDYQQNFLNFNDKFQDLRRAGTYYTHVVINESKKYLSGKALEFFQARFIHFRSMQPRSISEREWILLFEQFEKDYPYSEYSKYLKPNIDKIINYHRVIKQQSQVMTFMDNYENVNTLEEAIKPLQGKKIYIDVWATWCGPCLIEFAHNEGLKKILAENDIQQLYISIDKDDDDQKWKNMIKYYNLTGTQIRANEEFRSNLAKLFSEKNPQLAIPWYILIDEQGNIIEKHAKRPSQLVAGEKLW